jgi:D-alanyl-D-alanine carboxypeptidase/D-alanyl-D-alanine-endopeptidase (penicillin-binding protein 4)
MGVNRVVMGREGGVMRRAMAVLALVAFIFSSSPALAIELEPTQSCQLTAPSCVPKKFLKQAVSKSLADPAILVLDPTDRSELHWNRPDSPSIPASVLKILTSFTALTYLGGSRQFVTSVHTIESSTSLVIIGQKDPWLTMYRSVSAKYGPAYAPDLILKNLPKDELKEGKRIKREIFYSGLYPSDLAGLTAILKERNVRLTFTPVTKSQAELLAFEQTYQILSPSVNEMVKFAVLFSDNRLSQRLAEHAALAHGYRKNAKGLQQTFQDALLSKTIGIDGLVIKDGSGLSKENRVTARTVVSLLTAIRNLPEYAAIYEGLPKSGKTGTLKTRYKKTAPEAVGLVRAKTGWVNGTVSLAGYITAGEKELVFAVLADRIPRYYSATERARASIDRMVASLAAPKAVAITP